ncbi:MAG: hypothetical protein WEB06_09370 [Actinomycetota bacterium]
MSEDRRAWNAWDAPYFASSTGAPARPSPLPRAGSDRASRHIRFADEGARASQRAWAMLYGAGALVCGFAATGLLLLASFVFSFGDPPDAAEVFVAVLLGGTIAVGGVVVAVVSFRRASRPTGLTIHDDHLEFAYHTFKEPLVVPRSSVRAVSIDDAPFLPFTNNERFPVEGGLPANVFADALDNWPAAPWDDFGSLGRPGADPSPGVIVERPDEGYAHDDPGSVGWADGRRAEEALGLGRPAFLWSAHGSSLPFLRNGAGDVPNVAVLFHESVGTPRPPWWLDLSPAMSRCALFRGGRPVRGLMLRVRHSAEVGDVFGSWQVVRPITAEDVTGEGLRVPRPLAGWRALAYAAIFLATVAVDVVIRLLR